MRAVIITPYLTNKIKSCYSPLDNDVIIAADIAFKNITDEGLVPNIIIGDFDHDVAKSFPNDIEIVKYPSEKDDTDTMLCIKYAISIRADSILIIGGIGGRLDHTIANIQSLAYCKSLGIPCSISDGKNKAFITSNEISIKKENDCYVSVFAYGGNCSNVSISGAKYNVSNIELDTNFPLGVSNEIVDDYMNISLAKGTLLIILSNKNQ